MATKRQAAKPMVSPDGKPGQGKSERIQAQLSKIMQMVRMNSQLVMLQGLLINSMDYKPIFVQLVHNTDNDGLLMFYITDFDEMQTRVVALDTIDHPMWRMIFNRFGQSNQVLVMKTNTLFMSYEFLYFLQLVVDKTIPSALVNNN